MGGTGGWEGQVDGRGRMMGGAGRWEGQDDGDMGGQERRWMGVLGFVHRMTMHGSPQLHASCGLVSLTVLS